MNYDTPSGNKRDKQCFQFVPQHDAEVCPRFSREWPFTGKNAGHVRRSTFTVCSSGGKSRTKEPSERRVGLDALLPEYAAHLRQKGVTVRKLFEEYSHGYSDSYRHANFGILLRRYMLQTRAVGHVDHYAGDQMYIDFAGDRLEVTDGFTGNPRQAEVFVAILHCSHYIYCEAVCAQRKEDLISACENALHFFGGAPMAIVPDNQKAAVTRSDRNEPVINEEFEALAEHYGCAVYSVRVRHPKDKALVENAVRLMYRSVYADIEGLVFRDLDSLNCAIRDSLEKFNTARMASREYSRRELFERTEADYLRPLPAARYRMKKRRTATIMSNSYVTLFKHHYSVPKEYIGIRVDIVYDAETLEIFHGLRHAATHHRDDTPYGYTQKTSHNLPGRHGSYEKDLGEIFQRAASIDNIVLVYLKEVAAHKRHLPISFRSCRGILSLERKFELERLMAACACASLARLYGYQDVLSILEKGDDAGFLPSVEDYGTDAQGLKLPQYKKKTAGVNTSQKQTYPTA
ncbi:MAG: IS21 family transposase [Paraprevotella sp.]|nr:IS21 family transposase [Paraprevotella sp.]